MSRGLGDVYKRQVSYLFRHKYPFEAEQILISPKLIIRSSVRSISEEEYHDRG